MKKILFLAITILLACIAGCQTVPIEKARAPTLYDSMVEQVAHDERTELIEGCKVLALSGTIPESPNNKTYDVTIEIQLCTDSLTIRHGFSRQTPDGLLIGMAIIVDKDNDGAFDEGSFMVLLDGIPYISGEFTQKDITNFLESLKEDFDYLLSNPTEPMKRQEVSHEQLA